MESGEHPLFRMWRDRLDAELAQEAAWTARRVHREAEWKEWYAAWHTYKERLTAEVSPRARPQWWNLPGWLLYLVRLHSPGRPN
jgi:hypothetical protein